MTVSHSLYLEQLRFVLGHISKDTLSSSITDKVMPFLGRTCSLDIAFFYIISQCSLRIRIGWGRGEGERTRGTALRT